MNKVGNKINFIGIAEIEADYRRKSALLGVGKVVAEVVVIGAAFVVWGAIWFASMA